MRTAVIRALMFAVTAAAILLIVGDSPIRDSQGHRVPIETLRGAVLLAVVGLVVAGVCFVGALFGFALLRSHSIAVWRVSLIGSGYGLLMVIASNDGRMALGVIGGVAIVIASAAVVAYAGGRFLGKKTHV